MIVINGAKYSHHLYRMLYLKHCGFWCKSMRNHWISLYSSFFSLLSHHLFCLLYLSHSAQFIDYLHNNPTFHLLSAPRNLNNWHRPSILELQKLHICFTSRQAVTTTTNSFATWNGGCDIHGTINSLSNYSNNRQWSKLFWTCNKLTVLITLIQIHCIVSTELC